MLLAILPLVSRAQDWQRAADRVCAPTDRLRGVSLQLEARVGAGTPGIGSDGQEQAQERQGKAGQALSFHKGLVQAARQSSLSIFAFYSL